MDRRGFVAGAAAISGIALPQLGLGQPREETSTTVAIASKNLQWLRKPEAVAAAAIEAGFQSIALSVGPAPAHVAMGDGKGLIDFVTRLRAQDIVVNTINCAANFGANPAEIDAFLPAAEAAGILRYTFGPYPYRTDRTINSQLDDFKTRLSGLAKQNARRNIRGLYCNRAGSFLGATIFDLLDVFSRLDPIAIGLCYDSGQGVLAGGNGSWITPLKAAAPFVGAVLCTDNTLQFQLDADQGGAFTGKPELLATNASNTIPRAYGGGGGRANPWIAPTVPLGTGLVDLPRLASTLKEINFNGVLIVQSDYPNGGAENGGQNVSLPPARILGTIKRDLLTLKAGLAAGGFV